MIIIEANKISKRYIISHQKQNSATSITEAIHNWWSNHRNEQKDAGEEFWALKDVSFSIKKGERVGIIGKNGSGKSTLLKILSQITHPTSGQATIHGRVASLLEVGSGFHPELTGRENIFLNGAILGMRRKEILTKFDGIVDFAEIEKFLDTPVKYYSSGMYVRLAFAVASHLEPDILIADEVLAVGDADFQKKCVSKMVEIGNAGTTILYVSHNLNSVKNLCDSAILLNEGKLIAYEKIDAVINAYLNKVETKQELPLAEREDRRGDQKIRFTSIKFSDINGNEANTVQSGQSMSILISFFAIDSFTLNSAFFAVSVINQFGEKISALYDEISDKNVHVEKNSSRELEIHINNLMLVPGKYSINLYSKINGEISDWILNAETLNIAPDELDAKRSLVPFTAQGLCYINHSFKINIA